MKKLFPLAIFFYVLGGCYTPLSNSGVATNKPWLEVPAEKKDFDGKQFDSCYQFRLTFSHQDAQEALAGQNTCIAKCCWRSEQTETVLDFNKNFEKNLRYYGRAVKYEPERIVLSVKHAPLINTTAVKVSPNGAIKNNGLVKLKREVVENPVRLAQIESQARMLQARRNAWKADQEIAKQESLSQQADPAAAQRAKDLLQRNKEQQIDRYFYQLNKDYQKKGFIFLISPRLYHATALAPNVYKVSCYAKVQKGTSATHLQQENFRCGVWKVDLQAEEVTPLNKLAKHIQTKYKN